VTEAELPASTTEEFTVDGYTSYLSHPSLLLTVAKHRVILLIRTPLAATAQTRPDLMSPTIQSVWVQLSGRCCVIVGGVYREHRPAASGEEHMAALDAIVAQLAAARAASDDVVFMGDFNLDTARKADYRYSNHRLMLYLDKLTEASNMWYLPHPGTTYRSHGEYCNSNNEEASVHESVVDHMYISQDLEAKVWVLEDASTDHRPLLASIALGVVCPTTKELSRRNFSKNKPVDLVSALKETTTWSDIHNISDVNNALSFFNEGVYRALDVVVRTKAIIMKMGGQPVYLKPDTLKEMEFRDRSRGAAYKKSRNRVNFLTRCDKLMSNLEKLAASNNSPTVLWEIANAALGKPRQPLPDSLRIEDGNVTQGKLADAGAMNAYYIEKVLKIRAGIALLSLLSPPSSSV
jgi:endonuclease/exonuclease/phosphatase family metal-dependent hydrolase